MEGRGRSQLSRGGSVVQWSKNTFDKDQDPHQSGKSNPDPQQGEKSDPYEHQNENRDPEPHQRDGDPQQ
jgi:hypothetical protein